MERGFKYRIYPNKSQRDQIVRTLGCCRFVYNRALDVKKTAYSETGKSIATNDLIKMIPAWKRGEKHTNGGETHPLQHGRYRGARGNRGGYNRLNARGEDVRP